MKKFCSDCGHLLDVSKKFCSECGAANPSFSLHLENTTTVRMSAFEQLRQKRLSIEKQLHEIDSEQKELQQKTQMQQEMAELEKQKFDRQEKEKAIKEKLEREELEAGFKKEIEQVKRETESNQQQTVELLQELRQVISQMDEENKRLRENVDSIVQAQAKVEHREQPVNKVVQSEEQTSVKEETDREQTDAHRPTNRKRNFIFPGIVLLAIVFLGIAYFLFFKPNEPSATTAKAGLSIPAETSTQLSEDKITAKESSPTTHELSNVTTNQKSANETSTDLVSSVSENTVKKVSTTPMKSEPEPVKKTPKNIFRLTETLIKQDLVGKRLSGCGIVLKSSSEINHISNVVKVENSSADGYFKYKVNLKVIQGGETYKVTPYLYYDPSGKLMKIDATNCE